MSAILAIQACICNIVEILLQYYQHILVNCYGNIVSKGCICSIAANLIDKTFPTTQNITTTLQECYFARLKYFIEYFWKRATTFLCLLLNYILQYFCNNPEIIKKCGKEYCKKLVLYYIILILKQQKSEKYKNIQNIFMMSFGLLCYLKLIISDKINKFIS